MRRSEEMDWEKEGVNYWENPDCPRGYLEKSMLDLVEFVEGVTLRKDFFKYHSSTDLRKGIEHYEHVADK
jgi:hypothetical protein